MKIRVKRKRRQGSALSLCLYAFVSFTALVSSSSGQNPDVSQSGGVSIQQGGGIRGTVKNPDAGESGTFIIEPTLGGLIEIDASEVKQATNLRPEQIFYRNFAPLQRDTVESHLKIAHWANEKGLSTLAEERYQRVIELDPENEEAHKGLKHVKENGVWVSKQEQLELKGLETVHGRKVSKQEAELLRKEDADKDAERYWKKEIQILYQNAKDGNPQAREALRRVKNPIALSPLLKTYSAEKHDAEGRVLLVQSISSIGTPAALGQLGAISLNDADSDVRVAALDGINRKKTARTEAIEFFRRRLRNSNDVAEINRAAYALNKLEAEQAIPDLINSLNTQHKRQVAVGTDQTGMSVDNTGKISGFSPGGGTRMKTVTETSANEEVHKALVSIVSKYYQPSVDFGFEVSAWIEWFRQTDQLGNFYPRRDR